MDIVIQTDRLRLRKLTLADAPFIFELVNDPAFIRNIGDRGVRSLEDAERYIDRGPIASYARNGFGLWCVDLTATGERIGICGLIKRDALADVDLGYAYLPQYWGCGYATEAALACLEYARAPLGLKRLVAIVDPANQGSIRVLEKVGMKFERLIRLTPEDIELKFFAIDI